MTSEKQSLVFWICLFALNQHNVAEEVGENPRQGPFNAALAQATDGAVMVLDEEIRPFSSYLDNLRAVAAGLCIADGLGSA